MTKEEITKDYLEVEILFRSLALMILCQANIEKNCCADHVKTWTERKAYAEGEYTSALHKFLLTKTDLL